MTAHSVGFHCAKDYIGGWLSADFGSPDASAALER